MRNEKDFIKFLKDLTKEIVDEKEGKEEIIEGTFSVTVSDKKLLATMDVNKLCMFVTFLSKRCGTENAKKLEIDITNKFSTIRNEISQLTTMIHQLISTERKSNEN